DASLGDVLIIGTQGRGVWTMANAKEQLFKESILRIEGGSGPDEIRLVLADSDGAVPTELEVWFKNDLQVSVPLEAVLRVAVHTGDDNERLIVENSFGQVTVPIDYDGGDGADDRLVFQGNYAGELLSRPLQAMDERRLDDQVVRTRNVETSVNAGILRSFGE